MPRTGLFDDLVRPGERAQPSGTGTGFFVTADGCFLTCQHVVDDATRTDGQIASNRFAARLVEADKLNDITVLKVSGAFDALRLAVSRGAKLGESVFTVGLPNIELQGLEPKFTGGEISSMAGAQDDPRYFQTSVAVQPGNSGGPLVNKYGNVVGIVTARLSDLSTLKATGALPQNVNYAIKAAFASAFLESLPQVAGRLKKPYPASERKLEDVVKEAQKATGLVLVY